MCTVSFLPTSRGFQLAMNRDEKRTRAPGLAPALFSLGKRRAILPREPSGGTWIAVNDAGICFALINWHRIDRMPRREVRSRGIVIEALAGGSAVVGIAERLEELPLPQLPPFRLIVADSKSRSLTEWQWDVRRPERFQHEWKTAHWFSSGFDEVEAERIRGNVVASVAPHDSLESLRDLHRSHAPERGAFSICMHRPDAATVSYTEVVVTDSRVTMRYLGDAPCKFSSAASTNEAWTQMTLPVRFSSRSSSAHRDKAAPANTPRTSSSIASRNAATLRQS